MKGSQIWLQGISNLNDFDKVWIENEGLAIKKDNYLTSIISKKYFCYDIRDIIIINSLKIYKWIDDNNEFDKLRDCINNLEEFSKKIPKHYYGDEIIKMIRLGQLKEGAVVIWHNGSNEVQEEFKICPTKNLWFIRLDKEVPMNYFMHNIAQSYFTIKEKEYLTFNEAVKTGKKFKYRTWGSYMPLTDVILEIRDIDEDRLEEMFNEKMWTVEE